MHKIKNQYLLTCYEDGTIKLTPRKPTDRDDVGRFTGKRRLLGRTVCPVCGTKLHIFAKEVA